MSAAVLAPDNSYKPRPLRGRGPSRFAWGRPGLTRVLDPFPTTTGLEA